MTGRIGVDDVSPVISLGAHPSKAVVGEHIPVRAAVWREGHDAVAATVVWTAPDGTPSSCRIVETRSSGVEAANQSGRSVMM